MMYSAIQRINHYGRSQINGEDKGIPTPVAHLTHTHCESLGADLQHWSKVSYQSHLVSRKTRASSRETGVSSLEMRHSSLETRLPSRENH